MFYQGFTLTRMIESSHRKRSQMWWQVICWSNITSLHHTSWCQLEFPLKESGGYTSSKKKQRLTPTITLTICCGSWWQMIVPCWETILYFSRMVHRYIGQYEYKQWHGEHCLDFIDKDSWLPNSPDLKPLDYCMWGAMLKEFNKFNTKP